MAGKRIYRYVRVSGGSYVCMQDEMMGCFFPMSADNLCYVMYMTLSASNLALALESGEPIPSGVFAADLHPTAVYRPTGSFNL
jgi:hypothetical protein